MSGFHTEYEPAHAEAQTRANASGLDVAVERMPGVSGYGKGFKVYFLPRPEKRYGHELRCEVVTPMRSLAQS